MRKSDSKILIRICAPMLFAGAAAWSQTQPPTAMEAPPAPSFSEKLRAQLQAVRDAALSSDYAWHELEHLTENIGPRPAGSRQAAAAAEYVAEEMRKLGLDVHLEPAAVSHFIRGEEKAELVEYPGRVPDTTERLV